VAKLREAVDAEIAKTVGTKLTTRKQEKSNANVPKPGDIGYSEGVYVPSVYLYADMIDSSGLVRAHPSETVARVFKTYLQVAVRIIRSHDGHIRSFDGDRVMGVFSGDNRADRAAQAAMQIKWVCRELIQPKLKLTFKSIQDSGWQLKCAVGIANGEALLIHAGIRDNDDLVSIGRNANFAAKLSDLRHGTSTTFIGAGAHSELSSRLLKAKDGRDMWEGPFTMELGGETKRYYRSSFWWSF
jgi:class 3 adenylate cyclase